ncbi:aspartate/glutamate racemase family protein [Dactylosporangium sp. NPDC048998]|uniref:aspartate/glutamate racemase family protein n=1 Tax=Dactylosporangium sp. NPDC048998 TaxID=3363976 RepID=UPI00372050FF
MPGLIRSPMSPVVTDAEPRPGGALRHPLVGIVGGMGPLASAEFLRGLYAGGDWFAEQDSPRILLYSDPAVVDRTSALDRGAADELRRAVELAVRRLVGAGAERVVIACVTAHHVFADLPPELACRCVSLVDVIHDELDRASAPHLLLCTSGAARAGIFSPDRFSPDRRRGAADRLVRLRAADQEALHREIYRLKRGGEPLAGLDLLHRLQVRYGVKASVAACTELHLVARAVDVIGLAGEFPMIDPLAIVASRIRSAEL